MNEQQLFERWTSVHALHYFEKYEDREITDQRIFDYIDSSNTNVLKYLLDKFSFEKIIDEFKKTLEDFK